MRRSQTRSGALALATLGAALGVGLRAPRAVAAPEFIYRQLTLPRGDVSLDLGLGFGHQPDPAGGSFDGLGMNLEIAGGVTHDLELGFRTGFRFDDDGQVTKADSYGRPFETETYGTDHDRMANPELRMRWTVARGANVLLGLGTRAYLPIEAGSRFGLMFEMPVAFRLGTVRIDTGLYVPVIFTKPDTTTVISIPVHLWIQASSTFWLGPLFGLRIENPGGRDAYPLGFGLGSALSRAIDLRAWFLFPDISQDEGARTFGLGVALQIRFE
ncbi:MAG TPA: hypothetical protein VHL80_02110 [Polyangia bacterium]|nr:hypothetical protein [Polyangia bacterium]